jgi:MFS transporter, FHS family, glucose/mannose:H+ symporter
VGLAIAFAGAIIMLSARHPFVAVAGLTILGIGFAAVFPVILGYVGDAYTNLSGTAFSVVFVIALTGGMLFPYATGLFADLYGLRTALMIVPVGLAGIFIVFSFVSRRVKRISQPNEADVEAHGIKVRSEK